MRVILELFVSFTCTVFKLLKPDGVKAVMAENLALKQQLLTLNRNRQRSPTLTTFDRFYYGLLCFLINKPRINRIAVIFKPATILKFHKALVKRKYKALYSNKSPKKPGRKAPDQALIDLIIEIKIKNPSFGYGRIAMKIYEAFGIKISRFAIGRILRKHFKNKPPNNNDGPSWLTFIGNLKDSLWSIDLFRCESIFLKSHWVMVIIDQHTRRIIGFAVHAGTCNCIAYCCMFNKIIAGQKLPQYLSSDNDPIFQFHRWKANLRVIGVNEIKTIPGVPTSHPFIERVIGTIRRECLDQMLFFNESDLKNKLNAFKTYYNDVRAHSSLDLQTPSAMAAYSSNAIPVQNNKNMTPIGGHQWKPHCHGLYNLPAAL